MLITKFHALIRNKVLWGIFSFIIVLAFVAGGQMTRASMRENKKSQQIGTVGDQSVTHDEFTTAQRFLLGLQRNTSESDEDAARVDEMTWQRIGLMQTARSLGLEATRSEVSQTIISDPTFAVDGVFQKSHYERVIASALQIPLSHYENYVRDRLTLRKMMDLIAGSAVWVPPMEIADQVATMTDEMTIEYTVLSNTFTMAEMDVPEADMEAYFEESREMFRVPDQAQVQYISLPVSNYLAGITIPDDDLREYYYSNSDDYTRPTTNDLAEPIPFDDVRETIRQELTQFEAQFAAGTAAQDIIDAVLGGRNARASTLVKVAETAGLELKSTELFSAGDRLESIDPEAGMAFSDAAFALDPTYSGGRVSDAVTGRNWVYVMALVTNVASYLPEFADVREQVEPLAEADARREAFQTQGDTIATAIREAVEAGAGFTNAVMAQSMNVTTSFTFAAHSAQMEGFPYIYAIGPSCLEMMPGDVSESVSIPGGALVIHMAKREAGDPLTGELMKATLRQQIERFRGGELFMDWQRYNLAELGHTDKYKQGPSSIADEG